MSRKFMTKGKFLAFGGALFGGLYLAEDKKYWPNYSRFVRKMSEAEIPKSIREPVFKSLIYVGKINTEDIIDPLDSFRNIQEFFTRRVKSRQISVTDSEILAPADSRVAEIRAVDSDRPITVKGVPYSISRLLTNSNDPLTPEQLKALGAGPDRQLYAVSLYLAPNDYHRYHSPQNLEVNGMKHIPGYRMTVAPNAVSHMSVLDNNERVVMNASSPFGPLQLAFISATGVGGIQVLDRDSADFKPWAQQETKSLKAGEEIGKFLLGSSIVMVVGVPKNFKWTIGEGDKVRYGQLIGHVGK